MAKHIHAEMMMQYAQDAMETPRPWERWQYQTESMQEGDVWNNCFPNPSFDGDYKYRRKPKILSVTLASGEVVSWPEPLNKLPEHDTQLWYLNGGSTYSCCNSHDNNYLLTDALKSGTLHLTEENAIQHIDALYKINTQGKSK